MSTQFTSPPEGEIAFYQQLIDQGQEMEALNLMAGLHGWCGTGRTSDDYERLDKIRAEYERHGVGAAVELAQRLEEELYEDDEEAEDRVAQDRGIWAAERALFGR